MSEIDTSIFTAKSSGVTLSFGAWFVLVGVIIIASMMFFSIPHKKTIAIGQFLLVSTPIVGVALITLMTINDNHPSAISIKAASSIQEIAEDKYGVSFSDRAILHLTHYDDGVHISSEPFTVTDSDGVESRVYVKFTEDRKDVILSQMAEKELETNHEDK